MVEWLVHHFSVNGLPTVLRVLERHMMEEVFSWVDTRSERPKKGSKDVEIVDGCGKR